MADRLGLDSLKTRFSLDSLYSARDVETLVVMATSIASRKLGAECRLFVHSPASRDYRELVGESLFTVPEDSLFSSFLSMKETVVTMDELSHEVVFDGDDMLRDAFRRTLGTDYVLPFVRAGRLLGFLSVAARGEKPGEAARAFLEQLEPVLSVTLYAALTVDARMQDILKFVAFSERLRSLRTSDELVAGMLEALREVIPFRRGAYFSYDEFRRFLVCESSFGIDDPPGFLFLDRSISGWAFEKRRPAAAADVRSHPFYSGLNMEGFIESSFVSAPVTTSQSAIGVVTLAGGASGRRLGPEYVHMLRIACSMIGNELENRELYARLEEGYFETVRAVAAALEAKDPATRGHSERVMGHAEGIARHLGLGEERIKAVKFAAILHDIGKVGISDSVIGKRGRLNPTEFLEIKGHTEIGSGILESSGLFETLKEYVKYHHEKFDGSGYYGKKKGEYPWESTIISLADMYDALTSDRPYREASDPRSVMSSLAKAIDVAFDARVYDAMVSHLVATGALPSEFKPS